MLLRRISCRVLTLTCMLPMVGCGDSNGPRVVPGKPLTIVILSGGEPVEAGQVDLSGSGGGAPLNEKGEAIFKHVPFGEYRVTVFPSASLESVIPTEATAKPRPQKRDHRDSESILPKQFRDEATTPLRLVFDQKSNSVIQFDLKQ